MMNRLKKRIVRENPTEMAHPREKGMVKTQLKIAEIENPHSVLKDAVYIVN